MPLLAIDRNEQDVLERVHGAATVIAKEFLDEVFAAVPFGRDNAISMSEIGDRLDINAPASLRHVLGMFVNAGHVRMYQTRSHRLMNHYWRDAAG